MKKVNPPAPSAEKGTQRRLTQAGPAVPVRSDPVAADRAQGPPRSGEGPTRPAAAAGPANRQVMKQATKLPADDSFPEAATPPARSDLAHRGNGSTNGHKHVANGNGQHAANQAVESDNGAGTDPLRVDVQTARRQSSTRRRPTREIEADLDPERDGITADDPTDGAFEQTLSMSGRTPKSSPRPSPATGGVPSTPRPAPAAKAAMPAPAAIPTPASTPQSGAIPAGSSG